MKADVILVTGGCRSGKSQHAESLALSYAAPHHYLATAEALDGEMQKRIEHHRQQRAGRFVTTEEPLAITNAIRQLQPTPGIVLLDCLTLWLSNLLHHRPALTSEDDCIHDFLALLEAPPCPILCVSNEVGLGIVPEHALARQFRDLAGRLNQAVAERADHVYFLVSGIPMKIK